MNYEIFITNSKLHKNSNIYSVMSSFIDSEAGLVLSPLCIWFILALVLNSETFYNCEANDLGVVWCSYNEQTNRLQMLVNKLLTW